MKAQVVIMIMNQKFVQRCMKNDMNIEFWLAIVL